ncbi:MAG: efflux RND transporter periplasmic adaptor subunit [Alphaproteobacteria bacterium]|nr:efflux RND transporter periplasmic adaptor subunit [Alphaproteobacteria bacterium]MBU2142342.1 efflux RND transporter periplasmic adaptor subunit [Alphaproteobacteria bacterium]MBU2197236.1 efflux RND transporter periplasmic adaptor subunit [Alphaproteobacteria bacterium]
MNRSAYIALSLLVVIVAYFGIRSVMRGSISSQTEAAAIDTTLKTPDAIVEEVSTSPHEVVLEAKGRTAPDKSVTVKAGTTGTVVSTPAKEGSYVRKGALLCGLDVEARSARVSEAQARRDSANIDYEAARTLASKGLTPANQEAAAKAALDATEAALNAAKVELSKTQIRAPFDGVFETQLAEAGDYLGPGGACGVLVDMTPVIVVAEVAEDYAVKLKPGMDATAKLASGESYPARIRYVSRTASDQTRTFIIEAEIESGDATLAAGVSASLIVPVGAIPATLISPSLLTLSDGGQLGVRYVEADNTVRFAPIQVIDEGVGGAWVTGLPDTVRIISMGQDYLSEGVTVSPVTAGGAQR